MCNLLDSQVRSYRYVRHALNLVTKLLFDTVENPLCSETIAKVNLHFDINKLFVTLSLYPESNQKLGSLVKYRLVKLGTTFNILDITNSCEYVL